MDIIGPLVTWVVVMVIIVVFGSIVYDYFLPEDIKKVLRKIFKKIWEGKKGEKNGK